MSIHIRDSSAEQIKTQWQGPGNIMDVLLLVGADVIQAALAQISGSSLPTPLPFSFGWVTYTFTALVSVFGDARLLPSADVSCFLINTRTMRAIENQSWILGRMLRDFEYGHWMNKEISDAFASQEILRGLCIAVYEPDPERPPGKIIPGYTFYIGYFVAVVQLCLAAIPWILYRGSNYVVFIITISGALLATVMSSLPHYRREKFACRRGSRKSCALTRGNGSKYVVFVQGNDMGLDLEDLASGAGSGLDPRDTKGRRNLQIVVSLLTLLWVALLITVDGLSSNTWYLIAIGSIGSIHALFLSKMHLRPEQVGIPLRYIRNVSHPTVMQTLMEAEDYYPGLGLSLLDIYFSGALRENERVFWDARRETLHSRR